MKREKWFLAAAAAVAAVMAFVPGAGSGLFGVLALPLRAVGWCLRALSLSGGLGNGVAIVLYVLVCAVPLVFWWSGKRRTEDWLLFGLRVALLPLPPQGGNGRDMFHRGEGGVAPVIRACVKAALRTQQSLMFLAADRAFQAGSPPFVFGQLYHNLLRLAIGVTNAVRKLLTNDNSCATMKTQRLLKNYNWRR